MFEELEALLRQWLSQPWMRSLAYLGAAIVLGWFARWILSTVILRLTQRTGTDLDDHAIRIVARPVFVTSVLLGVWFGARALLGAGAGAEPGAGAGAGAETELLVLRIVQTLALVVWVGAAFRFCRPLLDSLSRLADRVQWIETRTVPLIDNFGRVMLFVIAVYLLLRIWNLDVAPWLASAGVVGLALGFAAKDSLANLFGGLFIIADSPYSLGDYIVLETGERGMVTKIGLRSTRLLTRDDVEITVPNAQIAAAKILNEAGGRWEKTRVRAKVGVAYGSDLAQVKTVLMQSAEAVEWALPEPEPRVRLRAFGESSLDFEVMVWIEKPELRGRCIDALLTEIYDRLNASAIEIPFPQRTLHIAQPFATRVVDAGAR